MEPKEVRDEVQKGYARVANQAGGCCSPQSEETAELAKAMGYRDEDLQGVAGEANLGLGCGNPTAIANLQEGDVVVDLGSGAGFDALLAAPKIGEQGRFIGIDMTPEMLEKARSNAVAAGFARTLEFREGLIEDMPVTSESVDVVISNCVINLSPDKRQVFQEISRILKSGGRLAVSDVIVSEPLPNDVQEKTEAWVGCIAGALSEDEYLGHIRAAGFTDIQVEREPAGSLLESCCGDQTMQQSMQQLDAATFAKVADTIFSYTITATKP